MGRQEAIKRVRALHQKKFRAEQRRFIVQGRKMVAELLASSLEVHEVYATAAAANDLADPRTQVWPDHDLVRIGTFESGNEVVAVAAMPVPAPLVRPAADELVLALDGVNDPGNLGTALRVADWFGVRHVLLGGDSVDAFNPKCVQASMGSILRVHVHEVHLPAELRRLRSLGAVLYRAVMDGADVFTAELERPAVLVLGSESHGISTEVNAVGGTALTIPRFGSGESLNVAMAASALCMEFARRGR